MSELRVQCPRCKRRFYNFSRHLAWCGQQDVQTPPDAPALGALLPHIEGGRRVGGFVKEVLE